MRVARSLYIIYTYVCFLKIPLKLRITVCLFWLYCSTGFLYLFNTNHPLWVPEEAEMNSKKWRIRYTTSLWWEINIVFCLRVLPRGRKRGSSEFPEQPRGTASQQWTEDSLFLPLYCKPVTWKRWIHAPSIHVQYSSPYRELHHVSES